uniref:Uncharacterized protein n=1 Tax=Arundo donax TaxID=35708 RepID=A0A0A8XT57_ARUDO
MRFTILSLYKKSKIKKILNKGSMVYCKCALVVVQDFKMSFIKRWNKYSAVLMRINLISDMFPWQW